MIKVEKGERTEVELTGNSIDLKFEIIGCIEGIRKLPFMTKKILLKIVEGIYED